MKKRVQAAFMATIFVLYPAGVAAAADGDGSDTIRIGGGFALTGAESTLDVAAHNGAVLAVEEINAAGGIDGQRLELITHDSKYDMEVTAENARQAAEQDGVVAFIGYTDSDSVLAAGPVLQAAGIPFLTVGATSPLLPGQIGDMMFLTPFGDNVQAAAGAEHALERIGDRAYLLWDEGQVYTRLLSGYFKHAFTDGGGVIVAEDTYPSRTTDFSSQLEAIETLPEPPDFYYAAAMPDDVGLLVQQLRDAEVDAPIVGGDGYDTPGAAGSTVGLVVLCE